MRMTYLFTGILNTGAIQYKSPCFSVQRNCPTYMYASLRYLLRAWMRKG